MRRPIIASLWFVLTSAAAHANGVLPAQEINPAEFVALACRSLIVDVRMDNERIGADTRAWGFKLKCRPQVVNAPYDLEFGFLEPEKVAALPRRPILVICSAGVRSAHAAKALGPNARSLHGGIRALPRRVRFGRPPL